MKRLIVGFLGFFSLSTLLLLSACEDSADDPFRIGINPWPGYEFLYLAKEKGLFEKEGVNVQIIEYLSLQDVRFSMERGQIDAMASTLIEVLQIYDHFPGIKPRVVLIPDFSNGTDVILARKDITNIAGLRGKRIGAEPASLNSFILGRALEKEGISLADVTIVSMDQGKMEQALLSGDVDAVVTYPPVSSSIMRGGNAHKVFSSADIPGEVVDTLSVSMEFLAGGNEKIAAVIRAWDKALEYAKEHPVESYQIMAEREGVTPDEFEQAMTGLELMTSSEQIYLFEPGGSIEQTLRRLSQSMFEMGMTREPVETSNILYSGPINSVSSGK
ncbi:MAG: ABC transporter substrate-binding protein [Rhodospirillaceae bacterium]|jgi:NitT/TauT family transport system substrate-binding protein|nr:ABC transporter substrate-binding protein [Rhodospirillaceae bacterium]MBT5374294.1 ABC transporter substrate-binding protein [Rhodospirillaceae bacterium]MBT5659216.1 ABC transporter substrate-binding protein [Rhodospirillaceae bacterium]MBT5751918.1 ABC transporter substrate-binding protein [Rhodospirillaceae bacterium]